MNRLTTECVGLNLSNPIILGSSPLTSDIGGIKLASKAGFSAIVLKSLFEEELKSSMENSSKFIHPEGFDYALSDVDLKYGSKEYLDLIREAKTVTDIPIIASVNCVGSKWWVDYASSIEEYGADGLELNISYLSFNVDDNPRKNEQKYIDVVSAVSKAVDIPIIVKISPHFTSIPNIVKRLKEAGADGAVLFNRYYKWQINLENMQLEPYFKGTCEEYAYDTLRWVGIINSQIDIDVIASSGIKNEKMILQQILAGSSAVEIVSIIYEKGFSFVNELLDKLSFLMESLKIESIKDIKGKAIMDKKNIEAFERLQYYKVALGKYVSK
ncbi:MAG: dihydroorotate dehydrogenase-like protein [Deferribacterota bacterium]|nr:dihydroorotate dehydrogenase-like protein [Deferribacterota bacterium]